MKKEIYHPVNVTRLFPSMNFLKFSIILLVPLFFSSCGEMFSTTGVTPRPENINNYTRLFAEGGNIEYQMEEWVFHGEADSQKVTTHRVRFKFVEKVEVDSETWSEFEMQVEDFASGEDLYTKTFRGKIDDDGSRFYPDSTESGPRFFLLKATEKSSDSPAEFETLPGILVSQGKLSFSSGVLSFERKISGELDTLEFNNRLEEAWLVNETVLFGNVKVVEAEYTYGESGLLYCEQNFTEFDHRNSFGEALGEGRLKRVFRLL